jgi:hypothetical protein
LPLDSRSQDKCSLENKGLYYSDFVANSTVISGQPRALEAPKRYLACPGDAEDLANVNFAVAKMMRKNNSHEEAISYLLKAASYESTIKTLPETYVLLAEAYEKGSYTRLAAA